MEFNREISLYCSLTFKAVDMVYSGAKDYDPTVKSIRRKARKMRQIMPKVDAEIAYGIICDSHCNSCNNCGKRMNSDCGPCFGWECVEDEVDAIQTAARCGEWCPEEDEEPYISSASAGDYSPNCPWKAPGMSTSDFIR